MMYWITSHTFKGHQMVTGSYTCFIPLRLEDANMK